MLIAKTFLYNYGVEHGKPALTLCSAWPSVGGSSWRRPARSSEVSAHWRLRGVLKGMLFGATSTLVAVVLREGGPARRRRARELSPCPPRDESRPDQRASGLVRLPRSEPRAARGDARAIRSVPRARALASLRLVRLQACSKVARSAPAAIPSSGSSRGLHSIRGSRNRPAARGRRPKADRRQAADAAISRPGSQGARPLFVLSGAAEKLHSPKNSLEESQVFETQFPFWGSMGTGGPI